MFIKSSAMFIAYFDVKGEFFCRANAILKEKRYSFIKYMLVCPFLVNFDLQKNHEILILYK